MTFNILYFKFFLIVYYILNTYLIIVNNISVIIRALLTISLPSSLNFSALLAIYLASNCTAARRL